MSRVHWLLYALAMLAFVAACVGAVALGRVVGDIVRHPTQPTPSPIHVITETRNV